MPCSWCSWYCQHMHPISQCDDLQKKLHFTTLTMFHMVCVHCCVLRLPPVYLCRQFQLNESFDQHIARDNIKLLHILYFKTEKAWLATIFRGSWAWNTLPLDVWIVNNLSNFEYHSLLKIIFKYLFLYFLWPIAYQGLDYEVQYHTVLYYS